MIMYVPFNSIIIDRRSIAFFTLILLFFFVTKFRNTQTPQQQLSHFCIDVITEWFDMIDHSIDGCDPVLYQAYLQSNHAIQQIFVADHAKYNPLRHCDYDVLARSMIGSALSIVRLVCTINVYKHFPLSEKKAVDQILFFWRAFFLLSILSLV